VVSVARNGAGTSASPNNRPNNAAMSPRQQELSNHRPPSANTGGGVNGRASVNSNTSPNRPANGGSRNWSHKETLRTADARHRDAVPIAEWGNPRPVVPRMQTDRRGPVLETAGLQRAEIHVSKRARLQWQSAVLFTVKWPVAITPSQSNGGRSYSIAETRPGIAPISHQRARVVRREVITRMLPRITTRGGGGSRSYEAPSRSYSAPSRVILHQRGRIPHRPRPLAPIPLRAAVMAAEVEVGAAVAVEAPRMEEVVVAVPHMVAEATLGAAADRTDTKQQNTAQARPKWGRAFFFGSELVSNLATLSRRRGLPKCERSGLSRLDIGKMPDGARFSLRYILITSAPRQ